MWAELVTTALPSTVLRGIDAVTTLPAYFESANMRSLAGTVSHRISSQARAYAQLQRTKLKTDRKTMLIIIGIGAAAAVIWILYAFSHAKGGITFQ
jgi:hypothetical protein